MTKAAVETMSMTLALTGQTVDATGGLFLGPRFA